VDTTLLADSTQSIFDRAFSLAPGEHTKLLPYRQGFILLIHGGIEPARLKTFEEARAELISEYQKIREQQWLEHLRQRYQVQLYPEVLKQALKAQSVTSPDDTE